MIKGLSVSGIILCLIIGLVIGGFGVYGFFKLNPHVIEIEKDISVEKPLLLYEFSSWGENVNNPNEYLFDGYVYNFGGVEAKDVEITCVEFDASNKITNSIKKNIGNLASYSSTFQEITLTKNSLSANSGKTGGCIITNSTKGVNLIKNIPSLTEYYSSLI